jgi:solute carrier family 25 2-oxodicarboxylate transporter 21
LHYSQKLLSESNGGKLSTLGGYIAGSACGVTEAVAFSPFQVIKVRLMAKEHLGRYKNSLDCLVSTVKEEGMGALAIGLRATMIRNSIWNGLFYGTLSYLETSTLLPPIDNVGLKSARDASVGFVVGFSATLFNCPFDVVKSRLQSQLPSVNGAPLKYQGVIPSLLLIVREEGLQALYKGFTPKAIRLGVGQTVGLMMFKFLNR